MKPSNIIIAIASGALAIIAFVGILKGKTHMIPFFFATAFICLVSIADAKKVTK